MIQSALNESLIRRQRDRIDELEETIRQMRAEAKSSTLVLPTEWKLSPAQYRALVALYRAPSGFLTHEALFSAMRKNVEFCESSAANLIRKNVYDMRHRLAPYGIEIALQWGQGYALPPASRAVIKAKIQERLSA